MQYQNESVYENTIALRDISYDSERDAIGRGGFGTVYSARHSVLGDVAMKTISNDGQNILPIYYSTLKNEISILVGLRHPNIILFYGMIWEKECYAIVLEFMVLGDMENFLFREKSVQNIVKTRFIYDVALGIDYLHSRKIKIIHNDLKISNVLVSDALIAKISDFGLAQWRNASSEILTSRMKNNRSSIGATLTHISPEKWKDFNLEDTRCDIYSFGILMWEIYTEKRPFSLIACNPDLLRYAILNEQRPDKSFLPKDLLPQLRELIESCWHKNSDQRPKIIDVLKILQSYLADVNRSAELRKQTANLLKTIHNRSEASLKSNCQQASQLYLHVTTTRSLNTVLNDGNTLYDDIVVNRNSDHLLEENIKSYSSLSELNTTNYEYLTLAERKKKSIAETATINQITSDEQVNIS